MNMKNLKIGTQLKLGFALLLLFVVVLGAVSYTQTDQIHLQTEEMYNHSLKVRLAIGRLNQVILSMRVTARDLVLAKSNQEKQSSKQLMEVSALSALQQFNLLDALYSGPRSDIEEARAAFAKWNTVRDEDLIKLALSGDIEKVKANILQGGSVGVCREQMLAKINKIDDFAKNQADASYTASIESTHSLKRQLILLVVAILLLSLIINYILMRNIRNPLKELTDATRNFQEGDMNARSRYQSHNEFGLLSASFNTLADSIQANSDLDKKIAHISGLMLSEYDVRKFFRIALNALAAHTGSQMAAIYLLGADKKNFEHFESTGVNDNARQSFSADCFEGEFGSALSSRKVQHIKDIPEGTRFVFHTVSGTFIPHEIITLPIIADNEVIAIISLATVGRYGKQSVQLIDDILVTLSSRVEGIMAYQKMKEFSNKLEDQNRELKAQKVKLSSQAAELISQNSSLEMQKIELAEANRLKTSFLSTMSHELRTPLNSVIALSRVLNRRLAELIPEEEYSYLEIIERNGKLLLELINDILDIARIEAGREEIEITKFNINSLVAEVTSMIQPQAEQRNIELLHKESEVDLTVTSDAVKCRHILQNLIGNAVKFTEAGTVEISTRQSGTNIEIIVTDTGIGIEEAHLPHIFDEFRQADSSTSRKFGGAGLGLAIVKKYASLIGGTISVKSTPGKGSEFTLLLPVRHAAENRAIEVESTPEFRSVVKPAPNKPI